jgi:glycerol-3-phosphate dehydrogenase
VPSTAIVSAEELVKAYARLASDQGASILTNVRVRNLEPRADCIAVQVESGNAAEQETISTEVVEAKCIVNSAGLYADDVAAMLGDRSYRIYPVRGEYAEVVRTRADLVNALVYPLPHHDRLSLGVHLTKTLWGTVLVGPTARYIADKNDYEHDRLPLEEFFHDAQGLLPALRQEDLRLAYSGIRPKLVPPGEKGMADFVIARDPSYPRAIHLVGIESPGLTSAPAIAKYVSALVSETLD